jgi:cytochrome c-type biogenesis protein
MENLSVFWVLIAFAAGLASFLSPCVLPLVPGYISLISGVSIDQLKSAEGSRTTAKRAVIANSLAFNAGLSIIFLALGAAAGWIGASIISNIWVRIIGGIVIVLFGLQLIGLLKIGALYKDTRRFSNDKPRGAFGALALGMAFAAGWTPCIGPILGTILGLAATTGGWKSGLVLTAFYSAGLAVPFLLTGLGINKFLSFYAGFRRHLHKVEVVSGVVMIFLGVLIMTGYASRLASSSLAAVIPNAEAWVQRYAQSRQDANATPSPSQTNETASAFRAAPDVQLETLDGQPFRLNELRGRVVLLNFWATWCIPCREEIPELNRMQRDLEARGLSVVGVSWDDTAEGVRSFQRSLPVEYRVLIGGESVGSQFGGVASFPTTFIIDREGRIRQTIIGARDRAGFEAAVAPLLEQNANTTTASNGR